MDFGELFSKSLQEYKSNFKEFSKLFIYFFIIPFFIVLLVNIYFSYSNGLYDLSAMANFTPNLDFFKSFGILAIVLICAAFINYVGVISLTAIVLKKDKFKFGEALNEGKKFYWGSIGFLIVLVIFLILLFVAFIIPGIIFMIFWTFGLLIFIKERKGVIGSLKASFYLVRGRWWKTFGYIILLQIILGLVSGVLSVPSIIMQLVSGFGSFTGNTVSPGYFISFSFIDFIFSTISYFITIPYGIFFVKNMYFDYIKRK